MTELIRVKTVNLRFSKNWYTSDLTDLNTARKYAQSRVSLLGDSQSWSLCRVFLNIYNRRINVRKNASVKEKIIKCIHDPHRLLK